MQTPTLETDRLLLRAVTLNDAPALQRHFANWNVIRWIGSDIPWPYPHDGASSYIESMRKISAEKEVYLWGIFLRTDPGELIGAIEYRFRDDMDDNRGFWLSEPHWGKGIMTEAVAVTQDFVFFELGKTRLCVTSLCSNAGSKAVKQKTGARLIGSRRDSYHEGEMDQDIWEITPDSWSAVRLTFAADGAAKEAEGPDP